MSEEERRRETLRKALEETGRAQKQAQESARRFHEVEQGRPFGPLPNEAPERLKHQKVRPETLEGAPKPQRLPRLPRTRTVQAPRPRSRRGTFGISFRAKRGGGR